MAYSTALSQGISILLYIHALSEENCSNYLSTKLISEQLNIPVPTTVKVIRNLNNAKLTMAKEGAKGGILLAQPLSEITMLDVFLAVEPGKDLFKVHTDVTLQGQDVDDVKQKVVHHLEGAEIAMQNYLKDIRLTDLFHEEKKG
ncbi:MULTISPECIES: Rrf2 family transcriptional regulator [Paenibacillus]|uniref:BadM/Rrf2 family transcriptional regulator n=1 Tax=Paenibacillus pabuli TaxID=1472 RepID=A0A855Y1L7_9BACL|nr:MULTISPECIES: Rrf2 family transcriptional regulator [Paenibacillus]MCP1186057.1 Rrf2 family transcriptional regulator [Paenibacillus sp. 1781tsa1]PWW43449.1 BadM/Rrf2 family transcriptional regulator [Paenibacillus pabuli]PXW09356.1 BadM/Rrf2 family transcriptional regulator [Paenibacillus taichungensis]RAJ02993.1 BadM/Rrf2 family transcriptional regulator [Paenibacillus pabuli]SEK74918.1 transcriptional regulator, BadM/Rrf2 family [Paenibacillus sp. OK003]